MGLLDNGSNLSLISKSMLLHLFPAPTVLTPTKELRVQGLGESSVEGCIHLAFWLDGSVKGEKGVVRLETTFYVLENFAPGFCLGLDVMGHYGVDTLISESTATLPTKQGQFRAPITFTRTRPAIEKVHPAKSTAAWARAYANTAKAEELTVEMKTLHAITVPANCDKFVKVQRLPGSGNIDWMMFPRLSVDAALGAVSMSQRCLVRRSNTGEGGKGLLVTNLADVPVIVPKGTIIADGTPCPSSYAVDSGMRFELGLPTSHTASAKERETTIPSLAPETVDDSFAFDARDVTLEESEKMRAAVNRDVPCSVVEGCHVAHDETGQVRQEFVDLIKKHSEAFSRDGKPGRVNVEQMRIPLKPGAEHLLKPQGLRPLSPAKRRLEKKALDEFLEDGIIEESSSHLSFPVVIVNQRGKPRYCIDFRELNRHTVADCYPMQRADVLFSSLGGNKFFSSLDAARGYHQIPVHEKDRWLTAFATHQGFYQWNSMPFGLRNAPAIFQRLMDKYVLGKLRWQRALVYIDDVIVFSATLEEHLEALDTILSNAARIGLRFSAAKCFFGYPSLKVLGRLISADGLEALLDRTKAIRAMKRPESIRELYRVIGVFGFYRSFIPNFARLIAPLTALTQNLAYERSKEGGRPRLVRINADGSRTPVSPTANTLPWTEVEQRAFDELKRRLISPPCLAFPQEGRDYILYVDASYDGISAILHQLQPRRPLTRAATHCILGETVESKLAQEQERDSLFGPIMKQCREGSAPPDYSIREGALVIHQDGQTLWCLPLALLPRALEDLHDCLGHGGIDRTWYAVKTRFWRPGLAKAVREYVNSCDGCQRSKKTTQKPAGLMTKDREFRAAAFDTVSMDLVTGLPPSTSGFDAILAIECLWSKAVILIATRSTLTAAQLARLWFQHVTAKGFAPSKIISDRGAQFMSRFWAHLQAQMKTELVFSAAHHQQANPVERAIQTMETTLRVYCADHPKDWFKHLHFVELTLNSLRSSTTGYAPHDLIYVSRNSPWAIISADHEDDEAALTAARERCQKALGARKLATALQRMWYNHRRSEPPEYKVGDEVLVRVDERPIVDGDTRLTKLSQRHRGPWKVKEVLSRVAIKLDLPESLSQTSPIFTVDQVKLFRRRPSPSNLTEGSTSSPAPPTTPGPPDSNPAVHQPENAAEPGIEGSAADEDIEDAAPMEEAPRRSLRSDHRPRVEWDRRTHGVVHVGQNEDLREYFGPEEDLREYPVVFYSRQTTNTEKGYNITELEMTGVRDAVLKHPYYLDGAESITVVTDHKPLIWLLQSKKELISNKRVQRLRMALQGYPIKVVYKEGHRHINADALSRLQVDEDSTTPGGPLPYTSPFCIFQGGPPNKDDDPLHILDRPDFHSFSTSSVVSDSGES